MINSVIDGVCLALSSTFGAGYEIYTESIEQGLTEPCFSVFCLSPTNQRYLGDKFHHSTPICVQYFPSTTEKKSECNAVFETLSECLEVIKADEAYIRGTEIHSEYANEVLSVFITYNCFTLRKEEQENMGDLTQNTNTKG